jgi:catalytic LigB subunit of aromatic ring-opening dioxygenase
MAEIVGGVGMSHSSLITTDDATLWKRHEDVDRTNPYLRDRGGNPVTFAELEEMNGDRYAEQASLDTLQRQAKATRRVLDRLKNDVTALEPDVFVVVGDDQLELHDVDCMPALAVFYGDELAMAERLRFAAYEDVLGDISPMKDVYAMGRGQTFPGHRVLGEHVIASLLERGFDVTAQGEVRDPEQAGIGHAFGVVETQLMEPGAVPLLPVYVNCYWPPNQLPVPRCWDLGEALRDAIRVFPEDLRVVVVASGGLSHFSTDEELDARVLAACRAGDGPALRSLPPKLLNGGSSEIRNWIAVASACRDLRVSWDEYLPVYRSAAGTGVGLAFMLWSSSV